MAQEAVNSYERPARWPLVAGVIALAIFGALLYGSTFPRGDRRLLAQDRNFFGVLRVFDEVRDYNGRPARMRTMFNGHISHGAEFQRPELAQLPTGYYTQMSGVGRILSAAHAKPRRVGLIGLGVGTLAAYAQAGDVFRFYEINPVCERMAREYFRYLSDCRGSVDVKIGDGRLQLERESQSFDVIVLDAFSGDAIPAHLLTVEAFGIYLRHLLPSGVIAVHITNRYFDLRPVILANAQHYGLAIRYTHHLSRRDGALMCRWMLLSRDEASLKPVFEVSLPIGERRLLWTDDHASLLDVLWTGEAEREADVDVLKARRSAADKAPRSKLPNREPQ
jgi:hypothetical protein